MSDVRLTEGTPPPARRWLEDNSTEGPSPSERASRRSVQPCRLPLLRATICLAHAVTPVQPFSSGTRPRQQVVPHARGRRRCKAAVAIVPGDDFAAIRRAR